MACCGKARRLRRERMREAKAMKQLVQRNDWQSVRKRLIGTWAKKPEWACNQLRRFLGQISTTEDAKLRIVMNYLTGTGFRTGRISHPCVSGLRTQISMEMKKRKAKG